MRLLPCRSNRCRDVGFASLPDGSPYYVGTAPSPFPFRIFCARCKQTTKLRAADWNRLPRLTLKRLDSLELTETIAKDWLGQGFTSEQARDLIGSGVVAEGPETRGR